jgi:UDP-N-acetylglucosamine acyltransferase
MPVASSAQIHPTAIISSEADIGPNVRIGPYVVIDGNVKVGSECAIGPHVHLVGSLTMGQGNQVGTGTVIGSDPQHLAYTREQSRTEVGDFNIFREHVTIHRGSHVKDWGVTRIGNRNYFMSHSHVAHDCSVGNDCILVNGALMGGHSEIQDRVFLSGNTVIHQFCRMGRLSLLMGLEGIGKDVPPFFTVKNHRELLGVNAVGMKRAGIPTADITVVRKAYHILYRSDLLQKQAIEKLTETLGGHPLVAEILQFIKSSRRGVMRSGKDHGSKDAD